MYDVGKVGSLLYTVAGPFHPFGGAVDIVVVQQQDGSFKSSPWYVRFGKFQGVLQTREKVVNVAVNGVEAGFHMYLDSNGEAHFLRDADSNIEGGDFIVSPVSSGDEREVPMQDAELRKSKITSCDISTMEANVGDSKILARTVSRQSTILERMFGRKSIKDNAHAVDRVSSLERAEIAAELLDTKWSTNLSRGSKARSSNDGPSSSHLTDADYSNQVETMEMVLPDCSFDHEKVMGSNCDSVDSNFGSPHGGRRSLGDDNEQCVQTTSVKEEIVDLADNYEHKTGDLTDGITSTAHWPGLESLSNDLGTDKSPAESRGNSEDLTGREMHTKEVLSHGIFEIHAIESDITNRKSDVISQFVTVDSDGVDQNFTHIYSPTYSTTELSSEKHDVSEGITSMIDRPGSESLSNNLGTDKSINESIDIHGELGGGSEDVTGRDIRTKEVLSHEIFEIHAIETDIINGKSEVIPQFVTVDSDGVDQNFTHTNSTTYSTTDLSSERHDVSLMASGQDACQEKVVIISSSETVESSYVVSGILAGEVCDATGISLVDGVQFEECSRVSSEKIGQVTFEERTLSHHGASSDKEDMCNLDVRDQEVSVFEDSISQVSQAIVPNKDISVDTIANDHIMCSAHGSDMDNSVDTVANDNSAHSPHDLAYQHDMVFPDASSSVVEISSYMHENDPEDVTEVSTVETKTCNGDLDVSVIQTSRMEDESKECIAETANFPSKVNDRASPIISNFSGLRKVEAENTKLEDDNRSSSARVEDESKKSVVQTANFLNKLDDEVSPIISNFSSLRKVKVENTKLEDDNRSSSARVEDESKKCVVQTANFPNKLDDEVSPIISKFSSLSKVEVENTKLEDDNRSSSASGVETGLVPEEPRDEAEAVVSFSEFVEETQFQFSDAGSFSDIKTVDDVITNKAAGAGAHDESDGDADEQGGDDTDLENKPENHSDLSRPETSLVSIPGSELHSGDNNLEAKSLPNLRSHIHDLERSDISQLSRSIQSNGENNGVDPVKSTNSSFPEQEPEGTGDSKENSSPLEPINNPVPDDKRADDLKVDSFNPFVELSLCRHLLSEGMGGDAACKAFNAEKITLEKFRAMKQSLIRNNKLVVRIAGRYFPWDVSAPVVLGMVSFREEQVFEPQRMIKVERVEPSTAQGGSWRIWPFSFRRTRTMTTVQPVCESTVESTLSVPVKESGGARNKSRSKRIERKVRSLIPTSEELASLDLREGKNVVTFTFSTAMLGRQQVVAHIYLWKWNTHIVISDVDGTITKSDVLGQFMPMVGVDWSQNGVAHLFSAIKENGYQLLFLSARSISQAHLTRQFLFNLKQDGKALPDGPVVISPDGLFPSLYREVIRRAPHEFKISCLTAIKALFPPDSHPFYAGFGNRDTDELSYLKVGIPMGKIFIINPKGEVAVNRRVDTKSYTALHALVNGMFPPISSSSSEQEDYNTLNYWKMPLPTIDI